MYVKNIQVVQLEQGSQTRGPRAACGPPDALVRPANTSKNNKNIKFDQIKLILRAFLVNCGPKKLFFQANCGPRSIFSLECGPPTKLSLRPLTPDVGKGCTEITEIWKEIDYFIDRLSSTCNGHVLSIGCMEINS